MANQIPANSKHAAQLADAVRERGSATRQWATNWMVRTAGMTEKSAGKVVDEAVSRSLLIERDGALMPRFSSNTPSGAPSINPTRGTPVATAKKASKKQSSARKPASRKSTELTAEQKKAVAEGKALLNSIQGGGSSFTEPAIISKPRSAKKPSAKKASAKPASKKASAKRASKKPSAKRASKKASAKRASKKPSAKRASKKASAKRRTAKRASAKKASRKSNKRRTAKRASVKAVKRASRKPRAAKRASAKKASRKPKTHAAKKASAKKRAAKKTSRKSTKRSSTRAAGKAKKMSKSNKGRAGSAASAEKPKAKRRSAKRALVSSLKSAEHAAKKLADAPRKPRAAKRPTKPAKTVPAGRYTNGKGAQIVIHRTYARSNPAMGLVDLAAVGGGLLVGIIAADVTDRLIATRAPKDATAALSGVAAKDALQRPADGVRLLVQGGATGVFGLAAFLLRDRVPTAAAGVAGVAVGFGSNFITKLVADVIMPKIFKAKDASEPVIGNRLYADTQEYAYPAAQALPFGFRRQNYRGLPGFLGAPKSTTQRPFERAPEAVGPVASGAVGCGCGKCGGGAPAPRAGIKGIDLARLFPSAKQKCSSCATQQPVAPPMAVVIPGPLPVNVTPRDVPRLPDPVQIEEEELPQNPPRVSVRIPREPSPSKKKGGREVGTTQVLDLIRANRPIAATVNRVTGRRSPTAVMVK